MTLPNPLPRSPADTELSAEARELIARAREQLHAGVPAPVRQRLFERVIDEARRAEPSRVVPAAPMVRVRGRGVARVLGTSLAFALALDGGNAPDHAGAGARNSADWKRRPST